MDPIIEAIQRIRIEREVFGDSISTYRKKGIWFLSSNEQKTESHLGVLQDKYRFAPFVGMYSVEKVYDYLSRGNLPSLVHDLGHINGTIDKRVPQDIKEFFKIADIPSPSTFVFNKLLPGHYRAWYLH